MATKSPVEDMIDRTDGEVSASERMDSGEDAPKDESAHPSFKKYEEARIPVSSKRGALWKSRKDSGAARLKNSGVHDAWDEAVRYYKNDQTGKRNRNNPDNPQKRGEKHLTGGAFSQTENVVFSNVSALVPAIYAKNPDVTIHSPKGDEDMAFTTAAQKLIRTLMQKRTAPGINLKPKMRRNVVMASLANIAYIEVGYTRREHASEGVMAEIDAIAKQLEDATDTKKIEELEGQLQALDDKVDLLQPAGPWAVVRHPKDVIVDPDSTMPDHSDAKWLMIRDVLDTSFINAVYRKKDADGNYSSIYKPTHVLDAKATTPNMAGHDEEITSFSILKDDAINPSDYGYDDENSFKRAQRTFVWKVWDRITRRMEMYAENDWKWPIWVWDDPYGLDDFWPLFPLAYHSDPEEVYARGEVSYYLDQQDEINQINSQISRMRNRVINQIIYNKRAVESEAELMNIIRPTGGDEIIGVTVPEGFKLGDIVGTPPIPSVEYSSLFDKRTLFEAVDRVSGVPSVVKGVEFRTNTTNKAIDSYESTSAQRLDEKIDAIEEQIGRIGNAILVMCLQFMSKDEVVKLIGSQHAEAWPGGNMTARDAQERFQLTVTGGSSLKPTSKTRKMQAQELAQVVGQFGQASPVALLIVLRMLARAYSDELVIEPSDWEMIMQSIQGQMQPEAAPGGEAPKGGVQGGGPEQMLAKVDEMIAKMPPELRAQVGKDIAQGVPLTEILGKLQQAAQQQQPPARSN